MTEWKEHEQEAGREREAAIPMKDWSDEVFASSRNGEGC
jgi:hypothetical protein